MSASLKPCVVCHVEREEDTLDEIGCCPFCEPPAPVAVAEPLPVEAPHSPKKRPLRVAKDDSDAASADNPVNPVKYVDTFPVEPPAFDKAFAEANPQVELAQRMLCRRRLMPFIKRFRPKYLAGWVHEDICRRLERFVKEVEAGNSPRLLLMMPPRGGKSEIGSRHFPPWVLGQHPDWEIIAASHTSSLTLSFSRYIRDLLRDPAYHSVFPDAKLDSGSQSVENWNLTRSGGYLAAGVGTGITGRGAHILLLDDLVKDIEAADSATITGNTWQWYGSTAYTRLAPGGGVLGIMTWWSEADWAGKIQETMATGDGDVFEIVRYPAINEEGDEYVLPDDSIAQFPAPQTPPAGSRLTRPHGTALHPARYDTEAMLRIKRNLIATGQKRVWNALYQQNPTPDDGLFFTKEMIVPYTHPPQRLGRTVLQAWDFAITEKQASDYTVGITGLLDEYDNLYIVDVWRFRTDDGIELGTAIATYAQTWTADKISVEDGQIWKSIKANFEKACETLKYYPSYDVAVPFTDKKTRAHPARGRMQQKKVFFPVRAPWYEALRSEMMRFGSGGKHDDQVDALAYLVRLAVATTAPRVAEAKAPKSWKDKLRAHMAGTLGTSHMSA